MDRRLPLASAIGLIRDDRHKYKLYTFNDCYGGPGDISQACKNYIKDLHESNADIAFLKAVEHFGTRGCMEGQGSRMGTCLVRAEYLPCMSLHEYDGNETPYFDNQKYVLLAIKRHFEGEANLSRKVYEAWEAKAAESDIFRIIDFRWDSSLMSRHWKAVCNYT